MSVVRKLKLTWSMTWSMCKRHCAPNYLYNFKPLASRLTIRNNQRCVVHELTDFNEQIFSVNMNDSLFIIVHLSFSLFHLNK